MKELDNIQSLTNEQELSKVCANILLNPTDDDWYLRGKDSLEKGSPKNKSAGSCIRPAPPPDKAEMKLENIETTPKITWENKSVSINTFIKSNL